MNTGPTAFLQARGLTREFMGFYAVKDLDLDIREGDIHDAGVVDIGCPSHTASIWAGVPSSASWPGIWCHITRG